MAFDVDSKTLFSMICTGYYVMQTMLKGYLGRDTHSINGNIVKGKLKIASINFNQSSPSQSIPSSDAPSPSRPFERELHIRPCPSPPRRPILPQASQ
jgi:hypothetical protein